MKCFGHSHAAWQENMTGHHALTTAMATWFKYYPILWLATLVAVALFVPAGMEGAPAVWLYTQPGTGYSVKNVGVVVYDFQGNLVVVGRARDLKNLQGHYIPPPSATAAPEDVVWAKYTRDERPITFLKLGEADAPCFSQLVADRDGSIYGLAWFHQNSRFFIPLGVRSFDNGGGILVVKWTARGELVYAHHFGGQGHMVGTSLALKPNGHVLVAGDFKTSLELPGRDGAITLQSSNPDTDFFLADLSQDGNCGWARRISGQAPLPAAIASDQEGNCFMTGGFESSLSFEGASNAPVLSGRGGSDVFLAKYDANGRFLWARHEGGPNHDYGTSVKWDQTGCCYLFGRFGKDAHFGEGNSAVELACTGRADMFMACYTANGALLGAIRVGGDGIKLDSHWTIVMDEAGNRYAVGGIVGKVLKWKAPAVAAEPKPATLITPAVSQSLAGSAEPSAVSPARFETIVRNPDGAIEIVLETHTDALFVIESSVDLNDWFPVSTNRVTGGRLVIEDPQAAEIPVRFFRVRRGR